MRYHEVEPGQCLTSIAVAGGFTDRDKLLSHPDNEQLKRARPDPNLLRPGDRVAIPDVEPGGHAAATSRKHRFVIELPTKELRIVVRGHDGAPLANAPYELELDRELRTGTTDGGGKLVEPVRIASRSAELRIGDRVLVLRLSSLGPAGGEDDEIRDTQHRLHNLGFDPGPIDGLYGHRTRAALAVFQAEHDLDVTGEPDAPTRARLEQEHGC
ncbi:MAG: peptidoglycan-binding protein [Sandaracinaceae bacterium]|nr:peptidoglycan-binding protein [Sandaracinaceae bacterium]